MSLPVFWTCFEYLHGRWDLAFNWFDTGLGLSAYPRFISFYQYAGMQGATLFILALNVLFYILVKYRKKRNIFRWSFSLLIVSFLFFCSTYLHHAEEGEHDKSMIKKIAVIQANPPLKPDTNSLYLEFNTLKEMVLPFKEQHPDLIVCPEGYFESAPGDFPVLLNYIEDDTIIKKLKMLSAQVNAPILAGMLIGNIFASSAPPTLTAKPIKPGFYYDTYNAALMISAKQPTQVYTKHKMVPFEERIPFLSFFSLLERWHILALKTQSSFSLLNDEGIFTCGEMKILPAICFETVFPDYLAEIVRKRGANMIAVISSDNWALNSTGYKRNASYCTPLAIELQLPLVRSVTTGLSLVLDKYGNVKKIAGWNEQKVLIEDIELNNKRTFYIKYGNIAGLLSMYAFFIISLFCIFSFLIKKLY
jgi:apolipoprotein N-acyltransferase